MTELMLTKLCLLVVREVHDKTCLKLICCPTKEVKDPGRLQQAICNCSAVRSLNLKISKSPILIRVQCSQLKPI